MKYPIPCPKNMVFAEGSVPASFTAEAFEPTFTAALSAFRTYARRVFGDAVDGGGTLTLVSESGLGAGYRISIGEKVVLTASNNTGMNYAFATLLQLAEVTETGIVFPVCEIADAPDSEWRGVMLDLVRCHHEIEYLYGVADLCWFYKLNRLQLHLTDDQGVRFPFEALPKAVSAEHFSKQELTDFADYCNERGIVIVPEIDAPGHFRALNAAYPELFMVTSPLSEEGLPNIMRLEESVFDMLNTMYREVAQVFVHSPWIHIGGDEADIAKWNSCKISEDYRKAHGFGDEQELYGHCVARLAQMILDMDRIPLVWEGFSEKCNDMIPKETLVFAWESLYQVAPSLLKGGFTIINASWQPLYIVSPKRMWAPDEILDWEKNIWRNWFDRSAAYEAPIIVAETSAIAGGQICVWGDKMQPKYAYAPRHDMLRDEFANLCVRAAALAQKVWTSYDSPDKERFHAALSVMDSRLTKLLKKYEEK